MWKKVKKIKIKIKINNILRQCCNNGPARPLKIAYH